MTTGVGPGRSTRTGPLLALVGSSHPEPTLAVTAIATALAASSGRSVAGVVAVGAAVACGQLSVGWHNDWLDAERDRAAARADKPVARGVLARATVGRAAGLALVAVVPLSLLSGWRAAAAHVSAVACAWGYNARLKATLWSFVPFAVAFALLVAFVSLGLPGTPWPPWWALLTGALLGTGAHLANAAPDLDDDVAQGIRGLPHRLGRRVGALGAVALLVTATAIVTFAPGRPGAVQLTGFAVAVSLAVVGTAFTRRPASRAAFRVSMIVALIDVALLVAHGSVR